MKNRVFNWLYRCVEGFLLPISQNTTFFVFILLLSWCVNCAGVYFFSKDSLFLALLYPIMDCYVVCWCVWLLNKIHLKWVGMILFAVFLFSELFCVFFYKSLFTTYVVQLILETTGSESSEFILSTLTDSSLPYSVLMFVAIGVLAWLCVRPFRTRTVPFFVSFVVFGIVIFSCVRETREYHRLYKTFCFSNPIPFENPDSLPRMYSSMMRFGFGLSFNQAMTKSMETLVESVSNTQVDSCSFSSPLIVLIIGESYNKHHAHVYEESYLPTTPNLDKLKSEGSLVTFDDAVTPYNITSAVFRRMFSTWDNCMGNNSSNSTLFTAVFKKAGYNVHFVSNQFILNTSDVYDRFGGTIFNHSRLSDLQFTSRNKRDYELDEGLLSEIPSTKTLLSSPTLLIVHFIGQHVEYEYRYPEGKGRFTAEDEKTTYGGTTGKEITAHYDNSIHYNDMVVGKVLKMIENTDAVAIYLSDHGEEAYDWRDHHMRSSETPDKNIARYQYEIPFMFYMTEKYQSNHPDMVESIVRAKNKPFYSPDIHNVLFHLAGISHKDYLKQHDILSPDYDMKRKRIIHEDVDYDELQRD